MKEQKKYWLRGGIVGLVVSLMLILFSFRSSSTEEIALGLALTQPITILLYVLGLRNLMNNIPILILGGLATYFLIGALIAWIVGKIKEKKK